MILGFAIAECRRIFREPLRFLLFLAPWVALAVSLFVYSERVVREIPTGIIDQDQSSLSRSLVRALNATPQLALQSYNSLDELQSAFRQGSIRGGILLPQGISKMAREGKTGHVVVWRDASNPLYSNQVYQAISGVVAMEGAKIEAGRLVASGVSFSSAKDLTLLLRLDSRPLGNPFVDYLRNMAPGLLPVFLQLCLMIAGGNLLPNSWNKSNNPRSEFLGRSIPWFLIQVMGAEVVFGVLFPLWGIPVPSLFAVSILVGILFAASISFGAALARLLKNPAKTAQNLLAFNTPALLFSGYTFPEWAMPSAIEWVTRPLPFSLFVDAYRGITGGMGERAEWGWIGLLFYLAFSFLILFWPNKKNGTNEVAPEDCRSIGEFNRIWKTPGLALLVVVAPILYLSIYGALFIQKEESEIPMAVTGSLQSNVQRQILRSLDAHPRIQVVHMESEKAYKALQSGVVRGILELPENLANHVHLRKAVGIPLMIPASRFLPVGDLQRATSEVFADFNAQQRRGIFLGRGISSMMASERANALLLDDHPMFNPRETYGDFMLPGLGILILHQLMVLAMAYATATAGIGIGSLWKRSLLYGAWFGSWIFLWFHVGLPFFNVPLLPNYIALTWMAFLGLACAAGLGAIIGLLFRKGISVLQLFAFTSYPFFFLSGASWPREAMPKWIDVIGQLIPLRPWMLGSGRALRMGASLSEVQGEIIHLSLLAIGYFVIVVLLWWLGRRGLAIFSK